MTVGLSRRHLSELRNVKERGAQDPLSPASSAADRIELFERYTDK
jgi:hypothetical protein